MSRNAYNNQTSDVSYGSILESEALFRDAASSSVSSSGPRKLKNSTSVSFVASVRDSISSTSANVRDSIRNSLTFGGPNVSIRQLGGSSTIAKSSFNLIKNLVGAGVLALPSGV